MKNVLRPVISLLAVLIPLIGFTQAAGPGIMRQSDVSTQAIGPDGEIVETKQGKATLFLDQQSGELKIIFDLNSFSTGYKELDPLLANESDGIVTFTGNIGQTFFNLNEKTNDDRTYTVNGKVVCQGKDVLTTAVYDPILFGGGAYDGSTSDLRINFKLHLDPATFYIPGFSDLKFSALSFEVAPGLINAPR